MNTVSSLISGSINQIESAVSARTGLSGVPCGFAALDRVTGGWQNSELIVIGSRPSMGKTAFALSVALNASVEFNIPVAFFSLEMSSEQLMIRLISSQSEISSAKLKRGQLQEHEFQLLNSKINSLDNAPLFIDSSFSLSIAEFREKAIRLKEEKNVSLIILDYVQLMNPFEKNKGDLKREQEVSLISRSLKSLSKELNIPIIVLSQLSRAAETRGGDKKPQLSDLRDSGALEDDADLVCFIHRPEYYNLTEDEMGESTQGVAEIIIAKHRNGPIGSVKLRFIEQLAKFTDFEIPVLEPLENISNSSKKKMGSAKNWDKENDFEEEPPF